MISRIVAGLEGASRFVFVKFLTGIFFISILIFAVIQLFLLLNLNLEQWSFGREIAIALYVFVGFASLIVLYVNFKRPSRVPIANRQMTLPLLVISFGEAVVSGYFSSRKK